MLRKTDLENTFNISLFAFAFVPLVALSFYNHPAPADDYCFIDTVFKYSYWQAINFYYNGWTGRYFAIPLQHANPLLFKWIAGYKVFPIIVFLGLIGSLFVFVKELLGGRSFRTYLGMAGALFFLFIFKMASVSEAFYWFTTMLTYTLPNMLTLYWVVVMLRWYQMKKGRLYWLTGVWAAVLTFINIGCSEVNLVVMDFLIGSWFGYQLLINRTFDKKALVLIVVALISSYLLIAAPGNAIRFASSSVNKNLLLSLQQSTILLLRLATDWFLHTPLLLFTVLFLFWIKQYINENKKTYFNINPFWVIVGMFVFLVGQILPSYYGTGAEPAPRIINCIYFFFLIGWFYGIGTAVNYFKNIKIGNLSIYLKIVLVLPIVYLAYKQSANFKMLYSDWLRGRAASFSSQLYERYRTIENSTADVVVVKPIKDPPLSLFVEDMRTDPAYLWCKCQASYFKKKSIRLSE